MLASAWQAGSASGTGSSDDRRATRDAAQGTWLWSSAATASATSARHRPRPAASACQTVTREATAAIAANRSVKNAPPAEARRMIVRRRCHGGHGLHAPSLPGGSANDLHAPTARRGDVSCRAFSPRTVRDVSARRRPGFALAAEPSAPGLRCTRAAATRSHCATCAAAAAGWPRSSGPQCADDREASATQGRRTRGPRCHACAGEEASHRHGPAPGHFAGRPRME